MKKKIIVVTPHFGNGGAERVLTILIKHWLDNNREVSIITTQDKYHDDYLVDSRAKIFNIYYDGILRKFVQTYKLVQILLNNKNAIIVSFVNSAILLCGLASLFVKNKFVFSERCDPRRTPDYCWQRFVRNILFRRASICVFQTEMAKNYFSRLVKSKGFIIKNPINQCLPKVFDGVRRKVIAAVGRLCEQKNYTLLLHAFAKFIQNHNDYSLEIYGRGADEFLLKEEVNSLNLTDKVRFLGFCNNVLENIKDCSIYVSTSNFEGISNSMLEAMGMGIPTICTDCPVGGARETIKNNINGILIPVNNETTLVAAMNKIADNTALAKYLSHNAVFIKDELNANNISQQWLDLFDSL